MLRFITLLLLFISFTHCNKPKIEKDASNSKFEGIAPHEQAVGDSNLDSDDQTILAEAKGKSMIESSAAQIISLWKEPSEQSQIFFFWSEKDKGVLERLKTLHQLENEAIGQQLEIFLINMDEQQEKANAILRASGIAANCFYLNTALNFTQVDKTWNGNTPILFINNKTDEITTSYEQSLSLKELEVILGSFVKLQ